MATLVIPGTVQIGIEMIASGQPIWNIIHLNIQDGIDTPMSTLADVKTAWEAASGPMKQHPLSTTMVGYHYTDLRSATGPVAFLASTTAGTVTGGMSTLASSALIKLSTGTRSRSQQGRLYHGPLAESQVNADGRQIEAGNAAILTNAYTAFQTAMNSGSRRWVVASRKNLSTTPIATASCAQIVATQRRRLR